MNIFEILEIEPTNDYKKIRMEWCNKDKKVLSDPEKFSLMCKAYDCVDTPEKLAHYLNQLKNDFSHISLSQKVAPAPVIQDEALEQLRNKTTIFIPINIQESTRESFKNPLSPILYLKKITDPQTFQLLLVLEQIADVLTYRSSQGPCQVGQTYAEAIEIVNQHSHNYYTLIVQVAISVDRIHGSKQSEQNLSQSLNAGTDLYPLLLKNSTIKISDILTAEPMRGYANSNRLGRATSIYLLWPYSSSGQLLSVKNPTAPVESFQSLKLIIPKGPVASAMTLFGENHKRPQSETEGLLPSCVLL